MAHSIKRQNVLTQPKKSGNLASSLRVLFYTAVKAVRNFLHTNTVLAIALVAAIVSFVMINNA